MKLLNLKKIVSSTILIWILATSVYALIYIKQKLALPNLEGYEQDWDWQLVFFAIEKLPILIGLLVIVLLAETIYFKKTAKKDS